MLLSPQKEQFIAEYLLDGDAIRAANICAGNPGNVHVLAAQWLVDPQVVARLADHHHAQAAAAGINHRWLRDQLVTIVERCMSPQPVLVRGAGPAEQARSEQGEGIWTFDSVGATKALELLGQHIGFFARHSLQQDPRPYATPPASAAALSTTDNA